MKKIDPWKLAVILLGLILVFIAVRKFRSPRLEGNLPATLTRIDTTAVTELMITPAKSRNTPVRIKRSGGWKLMKGNQSLRLEQGAAANALRMLMELRPERMASKRKEKWDEYQVGDSTGTRIRVLADDEVLTDLIIGRSGFGQTASASYGGPAFTYVRIYGEPEVYAVGGFFDAQFNRPLNDWRDKSFTRIKKDSVTRISFRYPADSSFVIERREKNWMLGSESADSAAVKTYLSGLEYRNATSFADVTPAGNAPIVINVEGRKGKALAAIEVWPAETGWVARSSHQPETFFQFDETARREVLAGRKRFGPRR